MKRIDGELGVVGGEVGPGRARGGKTVLSILEIGNHHLRKIVLADSLRKHLETGKHARLLLGNGLSRGLFTRPYIAAVEVDGRKYKAERMLLPGTLEALFSGGLAVALLWTISMPLALFFCVAAAAVSAKDWLDFARF